MFGKDFTKKIFFKFLLGGFFFLSSIFIFSSNAYADVIPPPDLNATSTTFNTCGEIVAPGTYVLTGSITSSGACITITSNDVVIDGQGSFSITGDVKGDDPFIAYNFILLDIVHINGNISSDGLYAGGVIKITGNIVDLSNKLISATGYSNGALMIYDKSSLVVNNTNLSALGLLKVNGKGIGNFVGGTFPNFINPGTINNCGILSSEGIYILTQNIIGDCIVASDGVVLDGGDNGAGGHYIVDGNIVANGLDQFYDFNGNFISSTTPGYRFTLQNITVTGTTTSIGGYDAEHSGNITILNSNTGNVIASGIVSGSYNVLGSDAGTIMISNSTVGDVFASGGYRGGGEGGITIGDGGQVIIENSHTSNIYSNGGENSDSWPADGFSGNGGSITISTSTTAGVFANGGIGVRNGGNAGTILITNSTGSNAFATSSPVSAMGGSSVNCGYGGAGAEVTLINSGGYDPIITDSGQGPGNCAPEGTTQGHSGSHHISGMYSPLKVTKKIDVPVQTTVRVLGKRNVPDTKYTDGNLYGVEIPVVKLNPLKLDKLPTFGEGKSSFTFLDSISKFVFTPIPEDVSNQIKKIPKLFKLLTSVGIYHEQNRAALELNPILLSKFKDQDIPQGLLNVKNGSNIFLNLRITSDPKKQIVELVRTLTNTPLVVSVTPYSKGKVTGNWNGEKVDFKTKDGKVYEYSIVTPSTPGRYYISSSASPLVLAVDVGEIPKVTTPRNTFSVSGWFGKVFDSVF